jgi:carbonic anhydrase/acetyltransferase-like protein (isoleucine patch superfamily)
MSQPNLIPFNGKTPWVHPTAFIAPTATLIGDVRVEAHASVWFGCTLRGDVAPIVIGEGSNVQDGTVIHCASQQLNGQARGTVVGRNVTIGHMALLHACTIEDEALVGMKACVMDAATVAERSMLAAGSLLAPHKQTETETLYKGNPAKLARPLTPQELVYLAHSASCYQTWATDYLKALG